MQMRKTVVAGQFYPSQQDDCVEEINQFIEQINLTEDLPKTITAGIVPHAGWTFSGKLAAMVFYAIKQQHEKVHTFIIFGAAHSYFEKTPAVYGKGTWTSPFGEITIDHELAEQITKTPFAVNNEFAHSQEHSIEVQIPLIQHLFADAKILPIIVPPSAQAVELGRAAGRVVNENKQKKIICIGSTDLTHYGPRYGFDRMGTDENAYRWAFEVNDKMFIDLAVKMQPEKLLENAAANHNACGPGAAAAAVAFAKAQNVKKGVLLEHTNSNQVMMQKMGTKSSDSVGYAAMIF